MKNISNYAQYIIAGIVVAAGIYWYFFTGTNGDEIPVAVSEVENEAQTRFQTLVGELSPISFDTSIFSDSRFNSLVDLTTQVSSETVGRLDPFGAITEISD